MPDAHDMDPFETRLAALAGRYTDAAAARPVDAIGMSRAAIAARDAGRWSWRRRGARLPGRGAAGGRLAIVVPVLALVGVVGVAVIGRLPDGALAPRPTASADGINAGPVPAALRHSWQRPAPVTPGLDRWGSGSLDLAADVARVGAEAGAGPSASRVGSAGLDVLVVTAIPETRGCTTGDRGEYRWSLEGKGTVLTLTAITPDVCAAREEALAGGWVRSDLPAPSDSALLDPGTHATGAFDPVVANGATGQLSFTVPDGWKVKEDRSGLFLLHHLAADTATDPATDVFVLVFTQPRLAADFATGATCGPTGEEPGAGRSVDDLVAAISARPGVASTRPVAVTVAGHPGWMLDLHLSRTWTGGCTGPDGRIVAVPVLLGDASEVGAGAGLAADLPLRLILVDLTGGRTIAIVVYSGGPSDPARLEQLAGDAMPVIESFEFQPPPG